MSIQIIWLLRQALNQGLNEYFPGSLVMEALDGFMLIVEEGGRIEFASENVSEFLGIPQVRENFILDMAGCVQLA